VGLDLLRDLAVIEIDGTDLPWIELGDSEKVRSGDPIAIIGSPLGLTGTVTTGVISAVRKNKGTKILQTDAAVNVGSSGAPVVDTAGRVVGIVTSKLANTENLNFAVPASALQALLDNRDAPRTPEETRDYLKSTADWIIDEPGRYARTWDSLEGKSSNRVSVSERSVRAEAQLPANLEQLVGEVRYAFERLCSR
jgi:S1-C subfamily serine protease